MAGLEKSMWMRGSGKGEKVTALEGDEKYRYWVAGEGQERCWSCGG
jgi:hypothetical protein